MKPLLLLLCATALAGNIEIVPGKRLGEVSIGDSKDAMTKRGFTVDKDTGQLVKDPLRARLNDGVVVEAWVEDLAAVRSKLRYKGRELPQRLSLKTLTAFFPDCEKPEKGSGGILMNCAKRGIQIATSFGSKAINFAVVKN